MPYIKAVVLEMEVDIDIGRYSYIDSYITNNKGERIINMIPMQHVECMTRNLKVL